MYDTRLTFKPFSHHNWNVLKEIYESKTNIFHYKNYILHVNYEKGRATHTAKMMFTCYAIVLDVELGHDVVALDAGTNLALVTDVKGHVLFTFLAVSKVQRHILE